MHIDYQAKRLHEYKEGDCMDKGFESSKKMFSGIYVGVMVFHLVNGFMCYKAGLDVLAIYMLATSVLYLLLSILALVAKDIKKCFLLCFAEVIVFSIIGTLLAGYTSGYSLQLIGVIPLTFYLTYMNGQKYKSSLFFVGIEIGIFFVITVISMNLQYNVAQLWEKRLYALNTVVFVNLIVCFFVIFSKTIDKNEEILSNENNALKDVVNYDPLTGLMNRRSFDFYLEKKLQAVSEKGQSLCVVMCDIDNFKHVNDTYGHDFGDVVLKELGKLISSLLREDDNLFRWGGEEFLLLLQLDDKATYNVMERIRQSVEAYPMTDGNTTIHITISIGVSKYLPMISSSDLIKKADDALYESKKTGKNKITIG